MSATLRQDSRYLSAIYQPRRRQSRWAVGTFSLPRVLLVDDEPVMLRGMLRLLRGALEVGTAVNAEQALLLLAKKPYSVVVTDYEMPGYDGLWLLKEVEKTYPRIRRVLHSGSEPIEILAHIQSGLIQCFLSKPSSRDQLVASLFGALVESHYFEKRF